MIAQAGGLTYNLPKRQFAQPQEQPVVQQAGRQAGSPFDIPMGEDLAYVENLTNNYYNAYGRLKDFTETMWKDYGVDVTKPDFSQAGGGLMHDAFLKMDADLRIAANDLAQEKKIREEQRKAVLEGKAIYAPGYQEEAQLARTLPQEQRIISLELFPEVEQALQGVSNRVYNTPTEQEAAFATLKPMIAKYEQLKIDDPQNARRYQRQINALRKPTYSLPDVYFREEADRGAGAQKEAQYLTMAKKIANEWKGNWASVDKREYDPILKQQVDVVIPESGLTFGKTTIDGKEVDKIVKRYIRDKDGFVYADFANPNIPRERLDSKTTDEAVTTIFSNNPKYGGAEGIEFLNKFRGTSGTFDVTDLYAKEPGEYQQVVKQSQEAFKGIKERQQVLASVKEKIKNRLPKSSPVWDTPEDLKTILADYPEVADKLPNIKIEPEGDGFKFKTDFWSAPSKDLKEQLGIKKSIYTYDELIDWLADFVGEAVNIESAGSSTQTPSMTSQSQVSSANQTTLPKEQSKFIRNRK